MKLIKRILSLVLICAMALTVLTACADSSGSNSGSSLSETQVYNSIIAMKSQYPEGMRWTNDNYYAWKGGIYAGGYGCAGFAFAMSDAAFGSLPAREVTNLATATVRPGDIIRISDSHSVIVLKVSGDTLTIAEGNYNSSVHWGRTMSISGTRGTWTELLTRYPY